MPAGWHRQRAGDSHMAKTAWGIETGASTLKAVKLTHDGKGNVTIEDYASVQMSQFRLAGADDNVALLGALRELVATKGIKPTDVAYVSLAGRHAFSRVITLPPVGLEAMRETIANEARGQIPIKLEDAVWDYQRISPDGASEAQVNLYAVKREVVTALMNACRSAGLPVKGIQLAPLGIYNFIKYEIDSNFNRACVCIDIGAENTDLLIVDGEKTWIRVVPFAGNDVTKALLVKDKRLNPAMAESLKRDPMAMVKKFNEAKPDPIWKDAGSVLEAMKAPLRELVAEINRSVGFYKSQNEGADFRNLIMMGNGSRLINLPKFFEQQLQYQVFGINELTRVSVGRGLDPASIQGIAHTLAVPVGLALQATGVRGLATTNLIPQEMIAEEAAAKVRPLAIVGGGIVFLAGLVTMIMSFSQAGEASLQTERLEERTRAAKARIAEKDAILAGDVYRDLYAKSFNNVHRGAGLSSSAYDLLTSTVAEFESQSPEYRMYGARYPEPPSHIKVGEGGIFVTETTHALQRPEKLPEGLPEDAIDPAFGLERTTKVEACATMAINLIGPMRLHGKDINVVKSEANGIAERLKARLLQRLYLVLKPEAKKGDGWDREMRAEFGNDTPLYHSMLSLRANHGPFPDTAPDALENEFYGKYVTLAGGLFGTQLKPDQVTTLTGGRPLAGTALPRYSERIGDEFLRPQFHLALALILEGQPWRLPEPPNPAEE